MSNRTIRWPLLAVIGWHLAHERLDELGEIDAALCVEPMKCLSELSDSLRYRLFPKVSGAMLSGSQVRQQAKLKQLVPLTWQSSTPPWARLDKMGNVMVGSMVQQGGNEEPTASQ